MTDHDATPFGEVDWFRAGEQYQDPYPYYEWLRSHGPVWPEPKRGVFMVTGYEEAVAIYNDTDTFSSCNAVSGPFVPFPEPFVGDDVSDVIDRHRDVLIFSDQLPTFDPPKHTAHRGLLMRLITPKRMKENEEFMWRAADAQIDEFLARGECEFLHDYAGPFTLLVVADLLGVPEADHDLFRRQLQGGERPEGSGAKGAPSHKPLEFLYDRFTAYIEDRRRNPQDDVMTELATATFPDGSLPEVHDIMLISANLFSAGGETTARLLGTALRYLGERPDLQEQLRADRSRIMPFLEECVRLQSPLQGSFRMARRRATVGDVEIPAGASLFVMAGAANRDPRSARRTPRCSTSTGSTAASTWASAGARTHASARRWRGPRAGPRSSACSTRCSTSASRKLRTARSASGSTTTSRSFSCAASTPCTSSSRPRTSARRCGRASRPGWRSRCPRAAAASRRSGRRS